MIQTDLLSHSLLPSRNQKPWATPQPNLTELNHFNLSAYGLQLSLPTLNHVCYHTPEAFQDQHPVFERLGVKLNSPIRPLFA